MSQWDLMCCKLYSSVAELKKAMMEDMRFVENAARVYDRSEWVYMYAKDIRVYVDGDDKYFEVEMTAKEVISIYDQYGGQAFGMIYEAARRLEMALVNVDDDEEE